MVQLPVRRPPGTVTTGPPGRHRRPVAGALIGVSCAALLSACGGDDVPDRGAPTGTGAAATQTRPAGEDRSATWPGGSDDRDVVARRTVAVRRALDSRTSTHPTAQLLIRGLTVRGRIATLRFTAVLRGWDYEEPKSPGGMPPSAPTLYDINPGASDALPSAQLIDPVNLRRHRPLEDSEGEALAGMGYAGQSGDGQPIDASWMFAAPPADVDAMDVQIGSWPVFREVPVTRR